MTNLTEYSEMLEKADWWYMMSDDYRVYSSGRLQCMDLYEISNESEEHKDLWKESCPHGDNWKGC